MVGPPPQGDDLVDELDLGLVHCLQADGRISFRRVGAVLGVSEQTVARRYKRLQGDGLVHVIAVANTWSVGREPWLIRIATRPDAGESIAATLARRDDCAWVAVQSGGAEVGAVFQAASAAERDEMLLRRLPRQNPVLAVTAQEVLHRFISSNGIDWTVGSPLVDEATERDIARARRAEPPGTAASTDPGGPEDASLIAALLRDGRASVTDLARRSGYSVARTTRRLSALLRSGEVHIDVDIAHAALGFAKPTTLFLTVEPRRLATVGQAVADLPEVGFAAVTTGRTNLIANCLFRSAADVYGFLTDRIGGLVGIREAEIVPVLRQVKQSGSLVDRGRLTWPVP